MIQKYIIYVGTGGLCHMLSGLTASIKKALSENRILIIDCMRLGSFKNKVLNYFDINIENLKIEESYDNIKNEKYKHLTIQEFKNIHPKIITNKGYFIDKYNVNNFHKEEINDKIITYAGYGGKNINNNIYVKNNIINILKEKYEKIIKDKFISIHYRNTDMQHDINLFINLIKKNEDKLKKENIKKIFIATDDYYAFDKFKTNLKEFELFKINDIENCDGKCIHYYTNDKNKVVLSLLEDIYIILHSDYFIPSNKSGVSKWIIQMLNEKKNIFKLTNLKCKLL